MKDKIRIAIPGKEQSTVNYIDAFTRLGAEAVCVTSPEIDPGIYDGLLLPGGGDMSPEYYHEVMNGSEEPDPELDLRQMDSFNRFLQVRKPIFGICRGIQVINVCLGGSLIQDLRVKQQHSRMGGNDDKIHFCRSAEGSIMNKLYGSSFIVNSAHHQAIRDAGDGLKITLTSYDGVVEAVEHEELPVFGTQWHPERMCFRRFRNDGSVDGSLILSEFLRICGSRF